MFCVDTLAGNFVEARKLQICHQIRRSADSANSRERTTRWQHYLCGLTLPQGLCKIVLRHFESGYFYE